MILSKKFIHIIKKKIEGFREAIMGLEND